MISPDPHDRLAVLTQLWSLCKAERLRGLVGHYAYDLGRHHALYQTFTTELRELAWIIQRGTA